MKPIFLLLACLIANLLTAQIRFAYYFQQKSYKISAKFASFKIKEKEENLVIGNTSFGLTFPLSNRNDIKYIATNPQKDTILYKVTCVGNENTFEILDANNKVNTLKLSFAFPDSVKIYGTGEQFSYFELPENKTIPLWAEEQGLGRGDLPISLLTKPIGIAGGKSATYFPQPIWKTSTGESITILSHTYTSYRIVRKNHWKYLYIETSIAPQQKITIRYKPSYIQDTIAATNPYPTWAWGTILGLQGGRKRVDSLLQISQKAELPIAAIWIQDWIGKRKVAFGSRLNWHWIPNEKSYPNFKNWVDSLNQKNIKVLGYVNSFLVEGNPMFEEAKSKNFLIKNQKGEDYKVKTGGFDAYQLDLTNEQAANWIKEIIKNNLIGNGLSGWMADFAEWVPADAVLKGGSGLDCHNLYPVLWAKINHDAIKEAGKEGEIVFFNRSGYLESEQYAPLFWTGDQMTAWGKHDGIKAAVHGMVSASFSGVKRMHSDIGGYTSIKFPIIKMLRKRELLLRWAELAAFTPFFRTHEGLTPEQNIQFYSDSLTLAQFTKIAKLHLALSPYFQAVDKENLPFIRPLLLQFPYDKKVRNHNEAFFVGKELLVFPVLSPHKTKIKGYLPAGKWIQGYTSKVFEGGKSYSFEAHLGQPVVFWRKGSIWEEYFYKVFFP